MEWVLTRVDTARWLVHYHGTSPPGEPLKQIHDPAVRAELESRLAALRPDSERKWGSMTSDQMLWHVNQFLGWSLGEGKPEPSKLPMPAFVMRFFLLYMPWPKGAPTAPGAKARERYDFEAERARCKQLIARLVAKPIDGPWPEDPIFKSTGGKFVSQLQAKHLDHHFKQFGG
jgi:hypothetical protein